MNRPIRIVKEIFNEEYVSDIVKAVFKNRSKLRTGDIITGFEYIASLPLNEQIKVKLMPESVSTAHGGAYCFVQGKPIVMQKLYIWNGKELEVYDGD